MLVDVEKALLGKLTDPTALRECWDRGVRAEVFSDPVNQDVFRFIVDYWVQSGMQIAPTAGVVETHFEREKVNLESSPEALPWLIGELHRQFRSSRVQEIMYSAAELTAEDPAAALNLLYEEAWRAKETTTPRNDRVDMAANVHDRRRRYIDEAAQPHQDGAPFGFPEVDAHTGGFLPGEVGALAAFTKTGKSFGLINSAVEAHKSGIWVPYVASLEMPVKEFETRIDALYSGVGYGKMVRKELTQQELRRLHVAQDEMAARGPFFVERPPEGERTVANIVNQARQRGANYLIVDQLSWLEPRRYYRERRDQYKELIYDLKTECSRESSGAIPCFIAVQFNRQAVSTKGERGGMHNVANAADIEQTVDIVYGLHRTKEMRANNSMLLEILGSRRSDTGAWLLGWHLGNESSLFVRGPFEEEADA